jgi:hypothetical protein
MSRFIEGSDRRQRQLLPDCIDDYVAEDSPVRVVDMFVERSTWLDWALPAQPRRGGRAIIRRRC